MKLRSILAWSVGVALLLTLPAWAAEYRLQVVNLEFMTISSYTDRPRARSTRRRQPDSTPNTA